MMEIRDYEPLPDDVAQKLARPFHIRHYKLIDKHRPVLTSLDVNAIRGRLDEVFGLGGWIIEEQTPLIQYISKDVEKDIWKEGKKVGTKMVAEIMIYVTTKGYMYFPEYNARTCTIVAGSQSQGNMKNISQVCSGANSSLISQIGKYLGMDHHYKDMITEQMVRAWDRGEDYYRSIFGDPANPGVQVEEKVSSKGDLTKEDALHYLDDAYQGKISSMKRQINLLMLIGKSSLYDDQEVKSRAIGLIVALKGAVDQGKAGDMNDEDISLLDKLCKKLIGK